jgi:excinuclease ABC subunit C
MLPEAVLEKLERLPVQPGVYLFKDKKGAVIYVGKAKSLRARVRSYFQNSQNDTRAFIAHLPRLLGDLDVIVVGSEKEALMLENTLIKEHRPRFNVKLRDDKEYLSIRLAKKDAWPRLSVVRKPSAADARDGVRFFGPYHTATSARRTLHLINKHFQLRTCTDLEMSQRKRPCLQYQIKRCPAPCVYDVDKAWYDEQVDAVEKFLDNRHDELSRELGDRMRTSATELRFELAAVYRDQLRAIQAVRQEQRVVSVDTLDRDVLGLYREADLAELALLYIRSGKLADVATFSIRNAEIPDDELVAAFLSQHYFPEATADDDAASPGAATAEEAPVYVPIPHEVIIPVDVEGEEGIREALADRAGHKVLLIHPRRGPRVDLVTMAMDNARHAFGEKRRASDDVEERLAQLQERLRLPTLPRRIECCDISHLGGGDTVGAIVALRDGAPDKKRYRTFHVRTVGSQGPTAPAPEGEARRDLPDMRAFAALDAADGTPSHSLGGDDYAAMYEVLARRFRRSLAAKEEAQRERAGEPPARPQATREDDERAGARDPEAGAWDLPDLFVVDGGRGQLGVALAAAHDLGLHDLPIVGLAKEKENVAGETLVDRVYLPGQKNPIPLKSHSASLFFLARARDEAHRFSNRAREKLGKGRRLHSALDDVRGLGPATKKALLKNLGSLGRIRAAGDADLLAVPGVTARHVAALRRVYPAPTAPVEVLKESASVDSLTVPSAPGHSPRDADPEAR